MTSIATDVQIRWMIGVDRPEVMAIELASFQNAWTEEHFRTVMKTRNCIGMVVERQARVVGFMVYELLKSQLHVLKLAVHPDARRGGVGAAMVDKLYHKLSDQRRQEIFVHVRESKLETQQFFRSQGFRWMETARGHYEDTGEDAYVMVRFLETESAMPNRIAKYFCEGSGL